MDRNPIWLSRNQPNDLLTRELQSVAGCDGASIHVGPSRNAAPGESSWWNFSCSIRTPIASGSGGRRRRGFRGARAVQRPG